MRIQLFYNDGFCQTSKNRKLFLQILRNSVGILEDFSLYSKFAETMIRSLKELNFNVEKDYVFNKKQTLFSDFFLKQ